MVKPEKSAQALNALHFALVVVRTMAFEGKSLATIASVLDVLELLPTLLLRNEDLTDTFRQQLVGLLDIEARFGIAVQAFDGKEPNGG